MRLVGGKGTSALFESGPGKAELLDGMLHANIGERGRG